MRLQWPDAEKARVADFVVENEGTPADLDRAAGDLWKKIIALPPRTRGAGATRKGPMP
jgi:dephospho-CoA kinase